MDDGSLDRCGFELCKGTRTKLFGEEAASDAVSYLKEDQRLPHKKVTIVGIGAVGMAAAFAIQNQGLVSELALVDVQREKVEGEGLDLTHGRAFSPTLRVKASTDYAVSAGSDLVIVTAGVRQRPGESRLALVGRNLKIFKAIVPQITKHSPEACILVVANPADIMAYITWKLSGFPLSRVFASGTALDTSRFRSLVADRLGVATTSVHGMVLGEHGDSSVAVWSQLSVGGVTLKTLNPKMGQEDDEEKWHQVHRAVIRSAGLVIEKKGYTCFAIGLTCASLAKSILRNEHRVVPLSTCVQGMYGIEQEVFLSVPCALARKGIVSTLHVPLEESEADKLRASAATLWEVQKELDLSLEESSDAGGSAPATGGGGK